MITLFLATFLGWFLVILSFVFLFRTEPMKAVATNVIKDPGLFFIFALMTVIIGLFVVVSHNYWIMGWPVVVTILGWLILINGLFRLFFSERAVKLAKSVLKSTKKMRIAGIINLIIGLFLLVHVYAFYL